MSIILYTWNAESKTPRSIYRSLVRFMVELLSIVGKDNSYSYIIVSLLLFSKSYRIFNYSKLKGKLNLTWLNRFSSISVYTESPNETQRQRFLVLVQILNFLVISRWFFLVWVYHNLLVTRRRWDSFTKICLVQNN